MMLHHPFRAALEAQIEAHLDQVTRLLARLDRWSGDPDLEDDDPGEDDDADAEHDGRELEGET